MPLLIFNGLALVVTDGGWWVFWMALVSSLAVGAFSIFSAEWEAVDQDRDDGCLPPRYGHPAIVTGLFTSCSVHGCH